MEPKGKQLMIECDGYSLIMDSLKFHGSIKDLLRQQTDQLLILSANMDEIKEETELLLKHPKLAAKFDNGGYLAAAVSQQLNAGKNFKEYFSGLKLKDQKLMFVVHEQACLSKLVVSIMLAKKYELNVFNIHPWQYLDLDPKVPRKGVE